MAERNDLTVVHEPFSRVASFGTVEIGGMACRSDVDVIRALLTLVKSGPVFFKDTMDFRYPDVLADRDFLRAATHCVMVRRPEAVVASYLHVQADAGRAAMGFENLAELYDVVCVATEPAPFVLDGDRLGADPESTVAAYCQHVGIPFREEALAVGGGRSGRVGPTRPLARKGGPHDRLRADRAGATAGAVPQHRTWPPA